jgi:heme/copper-type cytochrome/quinol oxidase subunit 2
MPRRTRQPLLTPAVIVVAAVLTVLAALDRSRQATARHPSEHGSVTLEQVAIAAGLLAVAVAAVAVIGKAVTHYTDLLN